MRSSLLFVLALVVALLTCVDAQAFGRRKGKCSTGSCGFSTGTGYTKGFTTLPQTYGSGCATGSCGVPVEYSFPPTSACTNGKCTVVGSPVIQWGPESVWQRK